MLERPIYLYQEIAESIRRRIASGELAPGDRLPAVRQLALDWSCTPGTVNRAYSILNDEGLVVSHRGRGTSVSASPLHPGMQGPANAIRRPELKWATLVNRADQYLLEAVAAGYSASEAQVGLNLAVSRWQALRDTHRIGAASQQEPKPTLRFHGSHDLVVETLASLMRTSSPALDLQLAFTGSLGGLMALARGDADVAGVHLWDEETDSYNEPFVRRLLPGEPVVLMTLVHRSMGLIMSSSLAPEIQSLRDLAGDGVLLVNRQRGSGTRLWLDAQLRRLGIDGSAIAGYETEATTHMAVAQRVADGQANVGVCIHAAAAAVGLDFLPLTRERYDLVFAPGVWDLPAAEALVQLVRSDSLRLSIEALGGYESVETGRRWAL